MAEHSSFFNSKDHDRKYNARHWADYFFPLFKSGVFNGDLQVVDNNGMSIRVKPGYAWLDGYGYHLTDGLDLDLETASGNMNRADSIVLRLDLTNRWVKLFAKTGNYYAGAAVPPEPTVQSTIHEIVIAHINVIAGTTKITQDMIEDTRMDSTICGWVCGTVKEIDFEQITAQFKAFMAKYESELNQKFEALEEYEAEKKVQFDTFQTELTEKEAELHEQHKKNLEDYFIKLQEEGNRNLVLITQQLIDFRNTNEAEFLEWFEMIKGIFGTDPGGEMLLKLEKLTKQVEFNRKMIMEGKVLTHISTSQGGYITDNLGNPILIGWSICNCR